MLKQLLQQLLNTRTTPGGVAHSASSTYTSPQWFNGTSTVGDKWTNGLYTGTAPNDGYLNISGSAYITTENVGSMIQAQIGDGQISQVSPMSGQGFNMLFPISKGASFSVNGIRLTDITVRFFKTIGGGYNLLVWRALSCLRALSNYLQRGFCKINIQTLPINAAQVQQLNQSISGGGQQNLIAPFCGWAVFQIGGNNAPSNQWFRLENSTRKTCYLSNASSSWKWASIPIQKGDTIIVDLGTYSSTGNLVFVRNESSK